MKLFHNLLTLGLHPFYLLENNARSTLLNIESEPYREILAFRSHTPRLPSTSASTRVSPFHAIAPMVVRLLSDGSLAPSCTSEPSTQKWCSTPLTSANTKCSLTRDVTDLSLLESGQELKLQHNVVGLYRALFCEVDNS